MDSSPLPAVSVCPVHLFRFMEKIQRLADEKKRKTATPSTPDTPTSVGGDSPRRSHCLCADSYGHASAYCTFSPSVCVCVGLPSRSDIMEEEVTSPTADPQRSGSLSSKLFSGLLSRNKEVPKKEQVAGEYLYM